MTEPGPGLHQRVGFAIGLRIGRTLRKVQYQRKPLQIVPKLGPWLMVYAYQEGLTQTGLLVGAGPSEVTISGGRKGHPGLIVGLRWRVPREDDWDWQREWQWR